MSESAQVVLDGVVAMDGPSGSGKSTVSRRLATRLGARYLDTGAMYRAMTWAVLRAGVELTAPSAIWRGCQAAQLAITTDPHDVKVTVDGVPVDDAIRGPEVTAAVSAVAAVPEVRAALVARQREIIAAGGGIVVEGRDIATVVAPDAVLKVYLTASPQARAARRSGEQPASTVDSTLADIARRDTADATRAADPLRLAEDAVELDTTHMGIDEVVDRLLALLGERVATVGRN